MKGIQVQELQIVQNAHTFENRFKEIPNQNSKNVFKETEKILLKVKWNTEDPWMAEGILGKNQLYWRLSYYQLQNTTNI